MSSTDHSNNNNSMSSLDSNNTDNTHDSNSSVASANDDDCQYIFPQRLMSILADERNHDAICWLPHGRGFIIRNRKLFAEKVMPRFFPRKSKYSSFTRKLNRWNFNRVSSGPELGAYYHEFFLREKPHLAAQMFCKSIRTKLAMANDSPRPSVMNQQPTSMIVHQPNGAPVPSVTPIVIQQQQHQPPQAVQHQPAVGGARYVTQAPQQQQQQQAPVMITFVNSQGSNDQPVHYVLQQPLTAFEPHPINNQGSDNSNDPASLSPTPIHQQPQQQQQQQVQQYHYQQPPQQQQSQQQGLQQTYFQQQQQVPQSTSQQGGYANGHDGRTYVEAPVAQQHQQQHQLYTVSNNSNNNNNLWQQVESHKQQDAKIMEYRRQMMSVNMQQHSSSSNHHHAYRNPAA